jgi:PAS domain-containing protein
MLLTTPFTELVAAFRLCEAQLKAALVHQGSTRLHATLFRKSSEILAQIVNHVPASQDELEEMLDFYARRRVETVAGPVIEFNQVAVLLGIDRDGLPRLQSPTFRLRPQPEELPNIAEIDELAKFVTRSSARIFALGADNRVLAVSGPAAAFYRSRPGKMLGQHVLELVGCGPEREEDKRRLFLAMQGEPQEYRYTFPGNGGGPRLLRAWLRRVQNGGGVPYAVLCLVSEDTDPDQTSNAA